MGDQVTGLGVMRTESDAGGLRVVVHADTTALARAFRQITRALDAFQRAWESPEARHNRMHHRISTPAERRGWAYVDRRRRARRRRRNR